MRSVILACQILEDEIKKALNESNSSIPVIWIDSSLHMHPDKLNKKLQEEIDLLDSQGGIENILFSFGYCGNAILGLKSLKSHLIIPQVNDCIELLLHANPNKNAIRTGGCYFLTRGWLKSEGSIANEYDHYVNKYGIEKTKRIMNVMLAHYRFLTLIDTGAYSIEECTPLAEKTAEKLELTLSFENGSIELLTKLLCGKWDGNFRIIPPGTRVSPEHFESIDFQPVQSQTKVI